MTVRELIERLALEDPNKRVVVDGYESGYDETFTVTDVKIRPNPYHKNEKYDNWYDGEFESSVEKDSEVAILLPRKS
jgi:hypothetical protein